MNIQRFTQVKAGEILSVVRTMQLQNRPPKGSNPSFPPYPHEYPKVVGLVKKEQVVQVLDIALGPIGDTVSILLAAPDHVNGWVSIDQYGGLNITERKKKEKVKEDPHVTATLKDGIFNYADMEIFSALARLTQLNSQPGVWFDRRQLHAAWKPKGVSFAASECCDLSVYRLAHRKYIEIKEEIKQFSSRNPYCESYQIRLSVGDQRTW